MASLGLLTNAVSHSHQESECQLDRELHDPALWTASYGGNSRAALAARCRTYKSEGRLMQNSVPIKKMAKTDRDAPTTCAMRRSERLHREALEWSGP
jgi:hypothetical protein